MPDDDFVAALDDDSALVRHVAAIAILETRPCLVTERSLQELLQTLCREWGTPGGAPPFEDDYLEITDASDVGQDIALAFANLPARSADGLVPPLAALFSRDQQFYELGEALLALAFPRTTDCVLHGTLDETQKQVLTVLVANDQIWVGDGNLAALLAERGLPIDRGGTALLLDPTGTLGQNRGWWASWRRRQTRS